jgi:DNA-binding NarL/FixJ family response regulator
VTCAPREVLLVDGNRLLRKGTELMLRSWGHRVIGSAGDAQTAFGMIVRRRPEVAVVDMDLPDETGAELVRRAIAAGHSPGVVLLLTDPSGPALQEALHCGALGVVLRSARPEELFSAVDVAGKGGVYVSPDLVRLAAGGGATGGYVLSKRERQVLELLAGGFTGRETSRVLVLSPETVRTHVRNAMKKLGAHTRVHAVTMAAKRNEIHVDTDAGVATPEEIEIPADLVVI